MAKHAVGIKSQAPGVIVAALIELAKSFDYEAMELPNPGEPTTIVIQHDLSAGKMTIRSNASPLIYIGTLVLAHSMMVENQTINRFISMRAKAAEQNALRKGAGNLHVPGR